MMILAIRDVRGEWDHVVCGVWGCSPPLAAVFACQALWGITLFPIAFWVRRRFSARIIKITSLTVLSIAIIAFCVIVIYEIFNWYFYVTPNSRKYFGYRIALATLSEVDFPVLMLLLSGLYLRTNMRN